MLAAIPARGSAQLAPVGIPRGLIRFELGGGFTSADSRYFDGIEQNLAEEWDGNIGSTMIPGLSNAEARIRQVTGLANYNLSLGRSSVIAAYQRGRIDIGLSYGLTNRITVFGNLPIIRVRTQETVLQDSTTANAGFNPADGVFGNPAGANQDAAFFTDFAAALDTLSNRINSGYYDGNPSQKTLAMQTLASATNFRNGLYGLMVDPSSESPVLPIATSTAGLAVISQLTSLQTTLNGSLGVSGFSSVPALPSARFGPGDFTNLIGNPAGPANALLLDGLVRNRQGDAEIGTTVTLIDRWHEDGAPSLRLAATALVRLPTGIVPSADILFDPGTGDGQTDIEGRLVADVARGVLGARLTVDYNDQLPANITRRVMPPTAALAFASTEAVVNWDPGNELTLSVDPFVRLADGFALTGGASFWSHGSDVVSYAAVPAIGAPAASVLALDTKASATILRGGILFVSRGAPHGRGLPVEARWTYEFVASSAAGRVDKTRQTAIEFKFYVRPFGG